MQECSGPPIRCCGLAHTSGQTLAGGLMHISGQTVGGHDAAADELQCKCKRQ